MPTNAQHKPTTTRAALLATLESFLVEFPNIKPETLGWEAVRDSSTIERLRNGGDVTTRKLDLLLAYVMFHRMKKEKSNGASQG